MDSLFLCGGPNGDCGWWLATVCGLFALEEKGVGRVGGQRDDGAAFRVTTELVRALATIWVRCLTGGANSLPHALPLRRVDGGRDQNVFSRHQMM